MKKKIFLNRILHRDKWRILISFTYDALLTGIVRQIDGALYSNTHKGWYVDDNENNLKQILKVLKKEAEIDISGLTKETLLRSEPEINHGYEVNTPEPKENSNTDNPIPVIEEAGRDDDDEEMIPATRTIKKVVGRIRYSPVEFRINEQDGRLAVRFRIWRFLSCFLNIFMKWIRWKFQWLKFPALFMILLSPTDILHHIRTR